MRSGGCRALAVSRTAVELCEHVTDGAVALVCIAPPDPFVAYASTLQLEVQRSRQAEPKAPSSSQWPPWGCQSITTKEQDHQAPPRKPSRHSGWLRFDQSAIMAKCHRPTRRSSEVTVRIAAVVAKRTSDVSTSFTQAT